MQIALMISAFDAIRRGSPTRLGIVILIHLLGALTTNLNVANNGCLISLPLLFTSSLCAVALAAWTITRPDYASKKRA